MDKFIIKPTPILLADDNEGDIILIEDTFDQSQLHYKLNVVDNGEQAMDYLNKKPPYENAELPEIILLDLNMPKMDGLDVVKAIKLDSRISTIPIFILTSSRLSKEIESAKALGANGFIVKGANFALQNLIDYAGIARYQPSTWLEVSKKDL